MTSQIKVTDAQTFSLNSRGFHNPEPVRDESLEKIREVKNRSLQFPLKTVVDNPITAELKQFELLVEEGTFLSAVISENFQYRFYSAGQLVAQVTNRETGEIHYLTENQFKTDTLAHRDRQDLSHLLNNLNSSKHEFYFTHTADSLRIRPVGLAGGMMDPQIEIRTAQSDDKFSEGVRLVNNDQREEGLNAFRESVNICPAERYGRHIGLLQEMAPLLFEFEAYDELKRMTNHLRQYIGGIGGRPKHHLAFPVYWCGRASIEQGLYRNAIDYLKQSLDYLKTDRSSMNLDHGRMHYYLALAYERLATFSEALKHYRISQALAVGKTADQAVERVLSSDPDLNESMKKPVSLPTHLDNKTALVNQLISRGWSQLQAEPEESESFFKLAIEYSKNLPAKLGDAYYGLASVLDKQGKIEEANEAIKDAIQLEEQFLSRNRQRVPYSSLLHFFIYQAYLLERSRKEPSSSINSVDKALECAFQINKSDPGWFSNAYFRKGWHFERNNDEEKAARYYHIATKIDPTFASAAENLSRLLGDKPNLKNIPNEPVRLKDYVPYAEGSTLHKRPSNGSCTIN